MIQSVESRMANMAVVCACAVALSHAGYSAATGSADWWFVRMTRYGLCCLAVPFFFTVSGYFLSRHFDERGWWPREVSKRVRSLLVPYLLWCMAFFIFARVGLATVKAVAGREFWTVLSFPAAMIPPALGVRLEAPPMLVPLWYVRALFVIVLLSPVLAWFASRRRLAWLLLVVLAAAYVMFSPHRNGLASTRAEHFMYYGVSLMGMFYFYLGILMRSTRFLERTLAVPPWTGVVLLAAGAAIVAWRTGVIATSGIEPFPILCIAIPFLVAGTWLATPAAPWPALLTSMSFPIYVLHFFVVFALDGFHACRADKSIGQIIVHAVCAVVIPCVIAMLARSVSPTMARLVFGGR